MNNKIFIYRYKINLFFISSKVHLSKYKLYIILELYYHYLLFSRLNYPIEETVMRTDQDRLMRILIRINFYFFYSEICFFFYFLSSLFYSKL